MWSSGPRNTQRPERSEDLEPEVKERSDSYQKKDGLKAHLFFDNLRITGLEPARSPTRT